MVRFKRIKGFLENIRYALRVRETPYIDNEALKKRYLEYRNLYHEKMESASIHRTNNNLTQTVDELFSAVDYSDAADLWERKAALAKHINDNKGNMPLTLIGTISGYVTSLGSAITMIPGIHTKGPNAFYDWIFWGLLLALFGGIYIGRSNQNRLRRLVEEHKDYMKEFDEVSDLLEKKTNYESDYRRF